MLRRQGDIFILRVDGVPSIAALQVDTVVAEGEVTGHQHRILDPQTAKLFRYREDMYLDVTADSAQLVHDEHGTILLERGTYRLWRQREYDPNPVWPQPDSDPNLLARNSSRSRIVFD